MFIISLPHLKKKKKEGKDCTLKPSLLEEEGVTPVTNYSQKASILRDLE
jgi:hypothetical protein